MARPTSHRRHWFSFSLRTMLIALTLACVFFGWWVNSAREQRDAVSAIRATSKPFGVALSVNYDYEELHRTGKVSWHITPESNVPKFLLDRLGVDFFHNVTVADVSNGGPSPDAALALFSQLRHLRVLHLYAGRSLSAAGLERLGSMRELTSISIDNAGGANEELFRTLSQLRHLNSLSISYYSPTDQDLALLAKLPDLQRVTLQSTQVTVQGLEQLKSCPKLRHLQVNHLPEADLKRLRQILPNCDVP